MRRWIAKFITFALVMFIEPVMSWLFENGWRLVDYLDPPSFDSFEESYNVEELPEESTRGQ